MTPAELAATLEAYAARHAADSALWERVIPEAAKALRASETAVEAEREACAQVADDDSGANEPAPESDGDGNWREPSSDDIRRAIAAAIRARA